MKETGFSPIMIALAVVIVLAVAIVGFYWYSNATAPTTDTNNGPDFPVFQKHNLQVIVIEESSCTNCYSLDSLVSSLELNPAYKVSQLEELDANSEKAQQLIRDYNIETLPTAIVTGDIGSDLHTSWRNSGLASFDGNVQTSIDSPGNTLVLRKVKYPYYSVLDARTIGEVQMIVLSDSNCTKCRPILSDMNRDANGYAIINQPLVINGDGTEDEQTVFVSTIQFVDLNSADGNNLLFRNNIKRLPAVLLSPSAKDYDYLKRYSGEIGFTTGKDGWLYNDKNPPFLVLESGNVRGVVSLVIISDANCTTCFNPGLAYRQFFETYDITVGKTAFYTMDSNEGRALINQYQLRHLPALITNEELVVYTKLASEWQQAWGTVEADGNFVFRAVPRLTAMALDANYTYTKLDENGNIVE